MKSCKTSVSFFLVEPATTGSCGKNGLLLWPWRFQMSSRTEVTWLAKKCVSGTFRSGDTCFWHTLQKTLVFSKFVRRFSDHIWLFLPDSHSPELVLDFGKTLYRVNSASLLEKFRSFSVPKNYDGYILDHCCTFQ